MEYNGTCYNIELGSGGYRISQRGTNPGEAPTYYLANFSRKLHENEKILGRGHVSLALPLDPPMVGFVKFCRTDPKNDDINLWLTL